jgi:hypothetical protein
MSRSVRLPTKPEQWLAQKQVAAQVSRRLRNLKFSSFTALFKLKIFYYTLDFIKCSIMIALYIEIINNLFSNDIVNFDYFFDAHFGWF